MILSVLSLIFTGTYLLAGTLVIMLCMLVTGTHETLPPFILMLLAVGPAMLTVHHLAKKGMEQPRILAVFRDAEDLLRRKGGNR